MDITACVVQGRIIALEELLDRHLFWDEKHKTKMEIELTCCKDILKSAEAYQ